MNLIDQLKPYNYQLRFLNQSGVERAALLCVCTDAARGELDSIFGPQATRNAMEMRFAHAGLRLLSIVVHGTLEYEAPPRDERPMKLSGELTDHRINDLGKNKP